MEKRSLKRPATLLILGTCINVACATIVACRGDIKIPIFGFDLNKARIYSGKKDAPKEVIYLNDPRLEKEVVCLYLRDWQMVREILRSCTPKAPSAWSNTEIARSQ